MRIQLLNSVLPRRLATLALAGMLAACSGQAPATNPTAAPVSTAAPTAPMPTAEPATAPAPTSIPAATALPQATITPAPGSVLPAPLYLLNEQQQIMRLERDGATLTTITSESAPIAQLAVSPADGTIMYIVQGESGTLVRTDARGGNRTEIASGQFASPVWSRDGQRYAVSWGDGPQGAGVYGAAANAQPSLLLASVPFDAKAQKPGLHSVPQAFSPDGSKLLLATAPDNGPDAPAGDIAVLGAAVLGSDGTAAELVGTGGKPYPCFSAVWSADGTRVVCSSYGNSNSTPALWSLPVGGGEPTILLPATGSGQTDVFSVAASTSGLYAFVGTAPAVGDTVSYALEQIDASGKAAKVRDELFDINAVLWSAWAPDASGIVIQRASTDGTPTNHFIWLPASDAPAAELVLRGQGTPVWGAPNA